MMLCNHGSMEYYNRDFPNGEPIPSVVGQGVCYDWRDEAQDREDESTWGPSSNPIVWLVHLEWYLFNRNWTRSIEPYLDDLTVEAEVTIAGDDASHPAPQLPTPPITQMAPAASAGMTITAIEALVEQLQRPTPPGAAAPLTIGKIEVADPLAPILALSDDERIALFT